MSLKANHTAICYLVISLASVPLFFLNVRDVHNWGDDYAQYIKEAKNIITGTPYYQSTYVYNDLNPEYSPPSYPPGFPLLIAPIVKISGISIRPMLYLISAMVACLMFALFAYFRKHMSNANAACLAIIGAYCGYITDLKASVLADIPLTLLTTLYLVVRSSRSYPWGRIILLIALAVAAMLVKSPAVIILFAEGLYFLVSSIKTLVRNKRITGRDIFESPSIKIFAGSLILYLLLMKTVFYNPISSWGFYLNLFARNHGRWLSVISFNFGYLVKQLKNVFRFSAFSWYREALVGFIEYTGFLLFLVGFIYSLRKKLSFDDAFFMLMCCMIIGLSVFEGLRYLLPALPVYLLYCFRGGRFIISRTPMVKWRYLAVPITIFYLFIGLDEYKKALLPDDKLTWTPYTKEDSTAFTYLTKNIPDSSIITFSKPRALALYTNKRTMILGRVPSAENKKKMDSMNIRYLLIKKGIDDGPSWQFLHDIHASDSTQITERYTLYTFRCLL